MLLLCDVGNTNIVIGIYKEEKIIAYWRVATNRGKTADEYGILLRQLFATSNVQIGEIKAIVISSVVPPLKYFSDISSNA